MLEISPQGPSGLPGKICLCGIGAAGTKVMEEVLLKLSIKTSFNRSQVSGRPPLPFSTEKY